MDPPIKPMSWHPINGFCVVLLYSLTASTPSQHPSPPYCRGGTPGVAVFRVPGWRLCRDRGRCMCTEHYVWAALSCSNLHTPIVQALVSINLLYLTSCSVYFFTLTSQYYYKITKTWLLYPYLPYSVYRQGAPSVTSFTLVTRLPLISMFSPSISIFLFLENLSESVFDLISD